MSRRRREATVAEDEEDTSEPSARTPPTQPNRALATPQPPILRAHGGITGTRFGGSVERTSGTDTTSSTDSTRSVFTTPICRGNALVFESQRTNEPSLNRVVAKSRGVVQWPRAERDGHRPIPVTSSSLFNWDVPEDDPSAMALASRLGSMTL
jgi:hypothetical protein